MLLSLAKRAVDYRRSVASTIMKESKDKVQWLDQRGTTAERDLETAQQRKMSSMMASGSLVNDHEMKRLPRVTQSRMVHLKRLQMIDHERLSRQEISVVRRRWRQ